MRFEVTVTVEAQHHFAIEAETTAEAQQRALELIGQGREPESMDIHTNVLRGVT